jgi:hypothetical protein
MVFAYGVKLHGFYLDLYMGVPDELWDFNKLISSSEVHRVQSSLLIDH